MIELACFGSTWLEKLLCKLAKTGQRHKEKFVLFYKIMSQSGPYTVYHIMPIGELLIFSKKHSPIFFRSNRGNLPYSNF